MKGLSIFLTMLLLLLAACKEMDDEGNTDGSGITVVRQDLLFDPQSRTGTLEFQANGAVSASLTSDWCTAVVNGNVVSVTVTDNMSIEGRVAILTLTNGTNSLKVPVQQRGMAMPALPMTRYHAENAGSKKKYLLQHDFEAVFSTEEDWIHPEMSGDSLTLTIDRNTTGQIRRGELAFSCGGVLDTLKIVQYDIQKNIIGAYYLAGNNGGSPYSVGFELNKDKEGYYMDWSLNDKWSAANRIPVVFDEENCTVTISSAIEFYYQKGDYERGFFCETGGSVTMATSSDVSVTATLFSNPAFSNATYGPLEDNGSWSGHTVNGFALRTSMAGGRIIKTAYTLTDIYLLRVGPLGSLDNQ
ncbi:MAG: BACON domain-containing protein [Bacteroidaceae bacterium]|nr:BACON domain-containing protein [Bacteroidaceae bacterium]